jgi:hypothetical protein
MKRIGIARGALTICALAATAASADILSATDQCRGELVETTPSSDFTALEGGVVVRHEPTGLEWQRCPAPMEWTGSGCEGTAGVTGWRDALQYADGESGWRLPNVKELGSIVERCRRGPAINQQVFPDTPASEFWSASPAAPGVAWIVNFDVGWDSSRAINIDNQVRLVRGGH